jgi:peptidoglycan/LPS O-acetylase OafA/YrhL
VFFPALLILSLRLPPVPRILSLKPFSYLGEISYSIYLLHFPAALAITTIDEIFSLGINYSSAAFFFTYFAAVIIISHITHYYFEKPMQNYIRKKSGLLHFPASGRGRPFPPAGGIF